MKLDNGVAQWISKASQAFDELQASMWNHNGIHLNTKLKKYKVVILTTLPDEAETLTARKLNYFHLSCVRRLLKLSYQDMKPDKEVLEQTRIFSTHAMPRQVQLR
ncbi:unnamed protein product [Schistocephalus solidus]|uniref:DHC_N2 domain-containing protein n=1 Tax=Schistocephalus solidus TaxID=70667 RepID=A0A183SQJ1_SCHSO|nr:unnamed protein product [Schistocephalus solidus]